MAELTRDAPVTPDDRDRLRAQFGDDVLDVAEQSTAMPSPP